ncbi:MAG: ThuA domain-containing protein [Gloeobacteraceae cyanobacterium ES-bin-144]|nr:ThuA domain-containing protein [Verrucomicrobiales bacterium]
MKKIPILNISPIICSIAVLLSAATTANAETTAKPANEKKIVFIAGSPSHAPGQHEHRAGCMLFADQLKKSGLPVNAVVTTNGWPTDESIFEGASAVVIYADGGANHPGIQHLDTLKKMAKDGVGIGCIHYACEITKGKPGDTLLDLIGGYFETDWSVNPHWNASFKLPKHPVTQGVSDFSTLDEWYYHMRFKEKMEGVTPILTDLPPPESLKRRDGPHEGNPDVRAAVLERKEPQHVMWVYERPESIGKGRSFGFTGGHFHKNWQIDSQRVLMLNAIVWIAGLDVPASGVPSKTLTDEEIKANLDPKP